MTDSTDDFLAHYGIPGMKWGHRKSGGSTSTKTTKTERTPEKEAHHKAIKKAIITGSLVAAYGGVQLASYKYGQHAIKSGQSSAVSTLSQLGSHKTASLSLVDGVWKLVG